MASETLDPRLIFVRASGAGRFNSAGLFEMIAAAQARFDYDPATLTQVNNIVQSEFPNGLADVQLRLGNVTAETLTDFGRFTTGLGFTLNSGSHSYAIKYPRVIPGVLQTFSAFVKMDDGLPPALVGATSAPAVDFVIALANLALSTPGYVVSNEGNGVYRVSCSFVAPFTGVLDRAGIYKYSTNSARGFKTTGWQLDVGPLTPYRPTKEVPLGNAQALGLRMEPPATNFIWPSRYADPSGGFYTVTAANPVIPGQLANRFVSTGTGIPPLSTNGRAYTDVGRRTMWSIMEQDIKGGGGNNLTRLSFYQSAPTATVWATCAYNLSTGVMVPSNPIPESNPTSGMTLLMPVGPNGGKVWLCWIAADKPLVDNTLNCYPYVTDVNVAGNSCINHHFQVELGNLPTSVIQTSTGTVTRSGDGLSINYAIQGEGTVIFEGMARAPTGVFGTNLSGSSSSYDFYIDQNGNNTVRGLTRKDGAQQATLSQVAAINVRNKFAYRFRDNDFAFSANGAVPSKAGGGVIPTVLRPTISLGASNTTGSASLNGWLGSFTYYAYGRTDEQLRQDSTQ